MILPGGTLGILGGGQLARMMGQEARRMGYQVAVMDPDPHCGARYVANTFVEAPWDSVEGAVELAEASDVVTLDVEHVPANALEQASEVAPVHPGPHVLRVIQDRHRQKAFYRDHDLPTAPFRPVGTEAELEGAVEALGTPSMLKARRGGYDGRGQALVPDADTALDAWEELAREPAILEAYIPFDREVSVVLARGRNGKTATYPLVWNVHVDGILHTSQAPAPVDPAVERQAVEVATDLAEALDHVGVLAVEMFVLPEDEAVDGHRVLVNETAPRVHNSGHLTQTGATSQFEQHVRAVCGLPLGDTTLPRPAAMVNLLGDLWGEGAPAWSEVLREPRANLHVYGKTPPRPGRKMGHVNITHADGAQALKIARGIHRRLREAVDLPPRKDFEHPV